MKKLALFSLAVLVCCLVMLVCAFPYLVPEISNLTPTDLGYQLAEAEKDNDFLVAGINETRVISRLNTLQGISIEALEDKMRPGSFDPDGSKAGFLGEDEGLIEVLAADNERVVDQLGLSHQEIARPLLDVGHWSRTNLFPLVRYRGEYYSVSATSYKGLQYSPFGDGSNTDSDITIRNLKNGNSLTYSLLVPQMIYRYGFYEGYGTSYRVDPEQVVNVFGLKKE